VADDRRLQSAPRLSRRRLLRSSAGLLGLSLPEFLLLRTATAGATGPGGAGRAKSCILLYCWGGMSHLDTWDLKPDAPAEVRGEFKPIATATPGVFLGEHIPLLARQTERLAIIRSIHHQSSAHGKGMYWNITGHAPIAAEAAVNQPPSRQDWPSLGAVVGKLRSAPRGIPRAVQLPYPFVDNNTLQAGENAGWLGVAHDPVIVRTPKGTAFGGVSRDLGAPVLNPADDVDRTRLQARQSLAVHATGPIVASRTAKTFDYFRELAMEMLLNPAAQEAFDLDREPPRVHESYGNHICGQSMLLARRLTEVGVPIVTVLCAAGDLNGAAGDHWDTHGDNFNRLKKTMLPTFDRAAAALLSDLADRGRLDDTLVVIFTEFGRTPKINRGAGRDHFPNSYSVALAGGGIRGGQVYGSSNRIGSEPRDLPCSPADLHATIFHSLGIDPDTQLTDQFGRALPVTDGRALPLF